MEIGRVKLENGEEAAWLRQRWYAGKFEGRKIEERDSRTKTGKEWRARI